MNYNYYAVKDARILVLYLLTLMRAIIGYEAEYLSFQTGR